MIEVKSSNPKRSIKKRFRVITRAFILILALSVILFLLRGRLKNLIESSSSGKNQATSKSRVEGAAESQTVSLDKKFYFPGLEDTGEEEGTIEMAITEVEKTDQVMVQDKEYTAKNEKTFLIVNLELKNETTKRLNIFPGDLIRLVVNDEEEKKLAPDLHNNYVPVSPISTKVDRVGFIIDKEFDSLKLQVGELEEEKEVLEIKFS